MAFRPSRSRRRSVPGPAASLVRVSPDDAAGDGEHQRPVAAVGARRRRIRQRRCLVWSCYSVSPSGGGTMSGAQQTTDQNGVATAGCVEAWHRRGPADCARDGAGRHRRQRSRRPRWPGRRRTGEDRGRQSGRRSPARTLRFAPGVRVVDAFGNPVGNVPVTFTPGPNSGTVTNGTVQPIRPMARVRRQLDPRQRTHADAGGHQFRRCPESRVTFSADGDHDAFNIEVRFIGDGGTTAAARRSLEPLPSGGA